MLEIVLATPMPALVISARGDAGDYLLNDAAKASDLCIAWPPASWEGLVVAIRSAHSSGRTQGRDDGLGICWKSLSADGRLIAWLSHAERSPQVVPPLPTLEASALMGLSVWRIDLVTQRIYQNATGLRLAGVSEPPRYEEGLTLEEVRAAVHPEDVAALERATELALADGAGVVDAHARHRQADGSWRTVFSRRIAQRDSAGKPLCIIGVSIDVTAEFELRQRERETQRRLARAEHLSAVALQLAGFAVWRFDLVTGERVWDDQMLRLRGFDPANHPDIDVIRRSSTSGEHLKALDASMENIARMVRENRLPPHFVAPSVDFQVSWPDGTRRWLRSNASVVAEKGENPYLLGLHWDITDSKQAEELRRQRAAAEEAARATSQALATVSHELRTPLNAILGIARRTLRTAADPSDWNNIKKIEGSAKIMLNLVNDILDLAKAESGKLQIERTPFNLREVLDYACDLIVQLSAEGSVHISAEIDPAASELYVGDALRLGQVLVNLLSNAAKFTRAGSVRLEVSLMAASAAAHRLRFGVTDAGFGMTEAQLEKLFKPFEQADASVQRRHGGTGLGLAISQRLVQAMGSHIEVSSAWGVGSTFSFAIELESRSGAFGSDTLEQSPAALIGLHGRACLVVDDNEINRELAAHLLSEAGAIVSVASSAREAMALLQTSEFSAVLMDCQMPEIDGYAATRAIRREPRWAQLPIIGLSGNVQPEDRERALRAGMDDYLPKPFDPDLVLQTIARWTSLASLHEQAP